MRFGRVKQAFWVAVVALVGAVGVRGAAAQEQGYWRASSSTAKNTTGDISIGSEKISINFTLFTIAEIRELKAAEVSSVFDVDASTAVPGKLYRLSIPGSKAFLHKNRLCGSDETQWMATDVIGRELHIAFFSGAQPPVFEREAIANSSDMCGTFVYSR